MKGPGASIEIKKQNRNHILKYILRSKTTSRQDIAAALGLSMPTILQNVKELQELGVVEESGRFESTGGRKANVITSISNAALSIGVEITKNHVRIVLIDLSENILFHKRFVLPYRNTNEYYSQLALMIQAFIGEHPIDTRKIAGVGISIPGIMTEDATVIADSHVLNIRNVSCKTISSLLPWKAYFVNDANAAALAELRNLPQNSTMVYLSLSNSVGGAIFINGDIYRGINQRSGEFGHMRIVHNGRPCYCGQLGCADAYCSALVLAPKEEKLEAFFDRLREGEEEKKAVWNEYMDHLAELIINIRMSFDCDIILGGYVGCYMEPWLQELQSKVAALDPFEQPGDVFLSASRFKQESSALGAAMIPMEEYMDRL
ncbi:ROK family transcriptional regulator [Lachnospiraceae bacterium ASD3451]|uniref:ROK family transcriptional regulator n=1 Tax=Diplocloster agilis TaxID=2850323 RepID=UPI001DD996B1|nr:ROK family transcriptional regulator [Diplocloster agilis]MBU9745305.1 ROK family transcriptional regulator [Diplocloster agilis]